MAKKKRDFNTAFSSTPTPKKLDDEKIKAIADEVHEPKKARSSQVELKKFNIRIPVNLYERLLETSKKRGVTMKAIVVDALWDKLGQE